MRTTRPRNHDRKHPEPARDAMDAIRDLSGDAKPVHNGIRYMGGNRDRALGESDRTGRHYEEESTEAQDEGSNASIEHEAD
jgi:hypothetical protein